MYKRVLLKISGEALSAAGNALSADTIQETAKKLITLQKQGVEIGVVVGGGNIIRGRSAGKMERNRADHMGMLATAINAIALQDALVRLGASACVLSAVPMPVFCDLYTARDAKEQLERGSIVIFACGSGCPFFSTDTAAALRAAEIGADVLLLAKNVDAVYSDDPKINPNVKRYTKLTYDRVIADNLHATDLTAITLCKEQHIPIHVFALDQILSVFTESCIGTCIS
ncbi:MAG: UMP kinase [Clostridia bacterium]